MFPVQTFIIRTDVSLHLLQLLPVDYKNDERYQSANYARNQHHPTTSNDPLRVLVSLRKLQNWFTCCKHKTETKTISK